MCNFLDSVSPQQRFETADQCYSSVTAQSFIWQRIVHPRGMEVGRSQRRGLNPPWPPLFKGSVSSPLSMPYAHGAIQERGLKLNIQKTKIMASGLITSWQIDGEIVETMSDFIFWGSKSLQIVIAAMKLKDTCSLEEK